MGWPRCPMALPYAPVKANLSGSTTAMSPPRSLSSERPRDVRAQAFILARRDEGSGWPSHLPVVTLVTDDGARITLPTRLLFHRLCSFPWICRNWYRPGQDGAHACTSVSPHTHAVTTQLLSVCVTVFGYWFYVLLKLLKLFQRIKTISSLSRFF